MRYRNRFRAGVIAVANVLNLLVSDQALAVGQEVGRLEGRVTEVESKAPIPGASVVVSGRALIGPDRVTTTDEDGQYSVPNLAPGTYNVEVTFQGVKPILRRVDVTPSVTTPLNISWSIELAQTQVTVVAEERHMTKPDSSMSETVFSIQELDYVPITRSYQATQGQAPGVINSGNANVKGSTQRQNRFMIDGMDITDPATNTFRGNWQYDASSAIQVITGGMEAKYNAIGAVTNLITRSGSDELHFNITAFYRPNFLTDFNTPGTQAYEYDRPFATNVKPPSNDYEISAVVDGPIIKHRLWYSASFRYTLGNSSQPPAAPLNTQAPTRVAETVQPRLKLTWAPTARHRFMAQFFADPTSFDFSQNNAAAANIVEPLAAFTQIQGGWHIMGEWDFFISDGLDTKVLLGFQRSGITGGPQGRVRSLNRKYGDYNFDRPRHQNRTDGSVWGNCCGPPTTSAFSVDSRPKFQADASITWRPKWFGKHEAEAGFQGLFSRFDQRSTPTGGGVTYVDSPNSGVSPAPLNQGLCDDDPFIQPDPALRTGAYCFQKTTTTGFSTGTTNYNFGFYIQDRWKPLRWLTILPGIRWDRYEDRLRRDDPNTPLPYGERVLTYGFGPRAAIITDLTGDQKTIFQVSYARATQAVYAATLTAVDISNKQTTTSYSWDTSPQARGFINPQQTSGAGTSFLDTTNRTPPHSDEILLRLSREIFRNSVLELEYTYKKTSNILQLVELNRIWDPSGNRVVGFINPAIPSPITLSTYPQDAYLKYSGVSLSLESRPTPNFDFLGSYTLSYTYGPAYEDNLATNQYSNPRQTQYFSGYAYQTDTRHYLKTVTSYRYEGLILGVLFNWSSGFPLRKEFTPLPGDLPLKYRSPIGTDPGRPPNDVRAWTEFRTADFFNLGLEIAYDFFHRIHQHVILSATITNALNLPTPTNFNQLDNDLFGSVSARQASRRVSLGLRYQY